MFDVDVFVADCRAGLAETQPLLAIKEVLERAVAEPDAVAAALKAEPGVGILHRSADLTVLSVVVPAGRPATPPHDHRMWALVGIYGGQEDNEFFRRDGDTLVGSGGKTLAEQDVLVLGDDAIHAVSNPLQRLTGAIHVYGGDFVSQPRSQWPPETLREEPYDMGKVNAEFAKANQAWRASGT